MLATAADELEDRWHVLETTDGEHSLCARPAAVHAYGVVMERDTPGVVWDEMSQIGSLTRRMLNFDEKHLHGQIQRRDPDLVVFMFGGNDMNTQGTMAKYREEFTQVIRLFRGAKDPLPCLVMAPLDHGERMSTWNLIPLGMITIELEIVGLGLVRTGEIHLYWF